MTSPSPDYYAVLQVPRGASQQEVARAYRALMRGGRADPGPETDMSVIGEPQP
ncbi:hypothetical protein [Arthrobacter globiformis]|uniref:hypothetical protein n=1 Tax=Arthrobacter globiformis TaxID=1665 RepID=UPI0027872742|nr:hypothetical protein [Arthrobacter globiformis]MDQ0866819.1 hypothetical protein [Arthrobacter globiformis]